MPPDPDATPTAPHPEIMAALVQHAAGRTLAAIAMLESVAAREPGIAVAHHNLATLLAVVAQSTCDSDMMLRALEHQTRAVELAPDNAGCNEALVNLLLLHRRAAGALGVARAWNARQPHVADTWLALSACLMNACRFDEARATYRQAREQFPRDTAICSAYCQFTNYDSALSPAQRLDVHRSFASLLPVASATAHTNNRDTERKLRLGLVSGDFRVHSCAFFLEPLLEHLDRTAFDVYLYSTYDVQDAVTARLKSHARAFRRCHGSGDGLGFKLWNDRIDILVDLSGHTPGNQLTTFQGRHVPVQGTYLGYPATTGLAAVQFRVVDHHTDPAGYEANSVESLARLPRCFLCYKPPEGPEPHAPLPSPIVFASFNNVVKLNDPTVSLWSRLILQTPGSVLLLKSDSFGEPDFVRFTHNRFHTQGLCTDRLILEPGQPGLSHHLAQYNRVHVALDPLTYNGTTTTCEALWMGVPVVTLAGDCHAARVSTSLLNTVGRPDLVARTEADYISIASGAVAQTVVDRNRVRRALASSTICDAPGFAEDFAALLRTQWRAWCATPP